MRLLHIWGFTPEAWKGWGVLMVITPEGFFAEGHNFEGKAD